MDRKHDGPLPAGGARVVDLFCGAGGLSYGLAQAGLAIAAGYDLDPACRVPFERNCRAPFRQADVGSLETERIDADFAGAEVRVLAACAPCQPFSHLGRTAPDQDTRWGLLRHVARLADAVRPELLTVENVPPLAKLPLWHEFVAFLEARGYHTDAGELGCAGFGVAQARRRLVLLASRIAPIGVPSPSPARKTVREAIGTLRPLSAGEVDPEDAMHAASSLSPLNLARMRASRPSGTWRDWPEDLRLECHRKAGGAKYDAVYGRMAWDRPSPTITTNFFNYGSGRFGHPEQHRALSLREGALLQSFPRDYVFAPDGTVPSFATVGRLIGNAVPPALGQALGEAVRVHLRSA